VLLFFRRRKTTRPLLVLAAPEPASPRLALISAGAGGGEHRADIDTPPRRTWPTLLDVVDHDYETDYAAAHVVDCGAGEGFFGAYALARGAAGVTSYEPVAERFEALARAARGRAGWRTIRAAVGARDGISPQPDEDGDFEGIRVIALADVLEQAARDAEGAPVVVKLTVDGAEAELLAATPPAAWGAVSAVLVAARGPQRPIARHLHRAGFLPAGRRGGVLHFRRR
jgi:FkbM family methyltransferase